MNRGKVIAIVLMVTGFSLSVCSQNVDSNNGNRIEHEIVFMTKIIHCLGEEGYSAIDIDNQIDMVNPKQVEVGSILTEDEKKELQGKTLSTAEACRETYDSYAIKKEQAGKIEKKKSKELVNQIGTMGLVSVSDDVNMTNYEQVEIFYQKFLSRQDAQITIFEVQNDGMFASRTFTYRSGKIWTYYVSIDGMKDADAKISGTFESEVKELKLTNKGYLIYTYTDAIAHGNLREYYRVKPLSDDCRDMCEKYMRGLSYVNYNMLIIDWDSSNIDKILVPCMFEDIYRICTGEILKTEEGCIPAKIYEDVMTTCFPVTIKQLRQYCNYNEANNGYDYEMIFSRQFPPFPEVVDYSDNSDGTITLYVDAVWPDYDSDYAFTNVTTVLPYKDGTFQYLSNHVEKKELDIPKVEQ